MRTEKANNVSGALKSGKSLAALGSTRSGGSLNPKLNMSYQWVLDKYL